MVTNLDFLTQFTKGDKLKMKKYIEMYLETAKQKMEIMNKSIGVKEFETIKIAAHTMKSQTKYMGISNIEADIISLEHACSEPNNENQIPDLVKKVNAILAESITELAEKIKTF